MSDISHELRTPLSVMETNLELLLRHSGDRQTDPLRWVEAIYAENKHMRRLIDDLLDMARLDAGVDGAQRQPVDVRELCADVAMLYETVMAQKGLQFRRQLPAAPCRALGDAGRLRQLLYIFLDNACKYTDSGEVCLALRHTGSQIELTVRDTGRGMPPELLERATERFARGDAARGDRSSTGLGLAIARRIVAAHQGRLALQSAPGAGTQVTVTLRAAGGREAH